MSQNEKNPSASKIRNHSKMNKRDIFYFWYFVLHIPITILIDSCLVIPKPARHWLQAQMVDFHVEINKDFLLKNPPIWLQVFGLFELCFQLPVFFLAAYKLYTGRRKIHVILALYGFNASFTTAVCLTYIAKTAHRHGLSEPEKWTLFCLYLPYLLIPAFMMVDSGSRLASWVGKLQKLETKRRLERSRPASKKGSRKSGRESS